MLDEHRTAMNETSLIVKLITSLKYLDDDILASQGVLSVSDDDGAFFTIWHSNFQRDDYTHLQETLLNIIKEPPASIDEIL